MEPSTGIAIGVTMYVLGACYIGVLFVRTHSTGVCDCSLLLAW
jgi:hypothetical protein